jgi:hypothetical protein
MNVLRTGVCLGSHRLPIIKFFHQEDARLHQKAYCIIYYLYVGVWVARDDGYLLELLYLVEQRFGRVIWVQCTSEEGVVCKQRHCVGLAISCLKLIEHVHD